MQSSTGKTFILMVAIFIVASYFCVTEATYRKPPFNGSIFGKRGTVNEFDTGKAFSAMCEIANEACQAWFPSQEKK